MPENLYNPYQQQYLNGGLDNFDESPSIDEIGPAPSNHLPIKDPTQKKAKSKMFPNLRNTGHSKTYGYQQRSATGLSSYGNKTTSG